MKGRALTDLERGGINHFFDKKKERKGMEINNALNLEWPARHEKKELVNKVDTDIKAIKL